MVTHGDVNPNVDAEMDVVTMFRRVMTFIPRPLEAVVDGQREFPCSSTNWTVTCTEGLWRSVPRVCVCVCGGGGYFDPTEPKNAFCLGIVSYLLSRLS